MMMFCMAHYSDKRSFEIKWGGGNANESIQMFKRMRRTNFVPDN
jgi:hypothetical protein